MRSFGDSLVADFLNSALSRGLASFQDPSHGPFLLAWLLVQEDGIYDAVTSAVGKSLGFDDAKTPLPLSLACDAIYMINSQAPNRERCLTAYNRLLDIRSDISTDEYLEVYPLAGGMRPEWEPEAYELFHTRAGVKLAPFNDQGDNVLFYLIIVMTRMCSDLFGNDDGPDKFDPLVDYINRCRPLVELCKKQGIRFMTPHKKDAGRCAWSCVRDWVPTAEPVMLKLLELGKGIIFTDEDAAAALEQLKAE
jgi:hypothetical protein